MRVILIFVLMSLTSFELRAQEYERDPAAKKAKKSAPKTTTKKTKKSRTVGDLLKGFQDIQKKQLLLPKTMVQESKVKPKALSQVAPIRSDVLLHQDDQSEADLEKLLDKEIEQLYKLTNRYKKSPNRGELWLRLAELYVEKARLYGYRAQNKYDKDIAAWESRGRKGRAPKMNLSVAKSFNKKAIQLYEWFLADFPKDPKVDQALFFLGYNYVELEQIKKGVAYYERLTKQHPRSIYVSESHFALGEYYFDNRDWKKAEKNYRRVLEIRSARLYGFALYKIAWCFYRQGRIGSAIKTLEQVVNHSKKQIEVSRSQGLKAVNRIRLASEALKDIVPFYSEVRDYKDAKEYFLELGGDKALFPLLERLAYVYSDAGKQVAARSIFKELLSMRPTAPKAFEYQYQIVQNFSNKGSRDIYRQELVNWINEYGANSEWARANSDDKELLRKAYDQRESVLRTYTLQQHQTAQNSRSPLARRLAREGYEIYIKTFEDSDKIGEMHFFYGELLYDMKEYDAAAAHYNWVAENSKKDAKYYEQAVLNAVLAAEKALPADEDVRRRAGDSLEPLEYGPAEKKFIASAERYIKAFPNGEKVPDIRFKLGRIAYTYNRFDEAVPIFQDIVRRYPKTQYATYSANLILDIYNLRKDYEGLAKAGTEMLSQSNLGNTGVSADIKDAVERATFKRAQEMESSGKYLDSAKQYEAFALKYPSSKLTPGARYNAAVNYERAGMIAPAIAGYRAVVDNSDRRNPTPEDVKKKSRRLLARLYEQTGQFEKAAVEFERYAKDYPKDQYQDESFYNAAVLWDGLRADSRSISNYEKYYENSRKADRREVFLAIAQVQERRGALSAAITNYEKYLNSGSPDIGKVIFAHYKIATISKRLRRESQANEWFKKTISVHKRLTGGKGIGASEAAESKYELSLQTLRELESIRIPANPQTQGEAVKRKLDLVNRLNNEMAEVIKYDDGNYVIAALATTGRAYDHMSRALYNAPVPSGFKPEERKLYVAEIDKIAAPLRETAIDNYKRAINKSFEIQSYNEWTIAAMAALNRYDGTQYPDGGDRVVEVQEIDLGN